MHLEISLAFCQMRNVRGSHHRGHLRHYHNHHLHHLHHHPHHNHHHPHHHHIHHLLIIIHICHMRNARGLSELLLDCTRTPVMIHRPPDSLKSSQEYI